MSDKKKIKVEICKKCSGLEVKALKGILKEKHFSTDCIGKCAKKYPELKGKVYGYIKGDFVVCDSQTEFLAKVEAIL